MLASALAAVLLHIFPAPDDSVLDVQGMRTRLSSYTTGKVTLLSLIYTKCGDGRGCPLATFQMKQLKRRLDVEPGLGERVRLVSLSFDPENDTPGVMRAYAARHRAGEGPIPWHFLTTRSRARVRPILEGFGQDVWRNSDRGGSLSHVLKLFLIDREGSVREIYSTSFLEPEAILGDVRALLGEEGSTRAQAAR